MLADDVLVKPADDLGGAERLAGNGLDKVVGCLRDLLRAGLDGRGAGHAVTGAAGAGAASSSVSTVMLSLV